MDQQPTTIASWAAPFAGKIVAGLAEHPDRLKPSPSAPAGMENLNRFILLGPGNEKVKLFVWGTIVPPPENHRIRASLGEAVTIVTPEAVLRNQPTVRTNNGLRAFVYSGTKLLFPNDSRAQRPDHIPRPMNAFICFRRDKAESLKLRHPGIANKEVSKILGQIWREASPEFRAAYREMAMQQAVEHRAVHPEYKYSPRKSTEITRRRRSEH